MRLIDADAAADKIIRETENRADDLDMIGIVLMIGIAKMLRDETDFPTIKAKPVLRGSWAKSASDELYCPYCSYVPQWDDDKYCANCGARMDGGAD